MIPRIHHFQGRLRAPLYIRGSARRWRAGGRVVARALAAVSAGIVAGVAMAEDTPHLALPIDCTLGRDCYVQQYVDRDPGPGVRDFACGDLANDGHKGTDFAVPTAAHMARGVGVLAAAPGTVVAIRDGMPDIRQGRPGAPDVTGVECGNGVRIDHGAGWETQYCHLRAGSVAVASGDAVAAGQRIGFVGLSGEASFPHVHVVLRHEGRVVDPFRPGSGCGGAEGALWDAPLGYDPGGPIAAGLAGGIPAYDAVKAGLVRDGIGTESEAVVLWAFLANGRAGDRVRLEIAGPDRPADTHTLVLEKDQPLLMRAFGRRTPGGPPAGTWRAEVVHLRDGAAIGRRTVTAEVP
jgi:hypothetical protein